VGAKREYQAQFLIGAKLLGSFRGAMTAAQNRMRALGTMARRVGGLLKTAFVGMLAGFGTFLAANVLGKMFAGASEEAFQAEQRVRALSNALLLNQAVAKGGKAAAMKELGIIYKHNQALEEQGVLHKDILDNMSIQLAMRGVPTKNINESVDVMQNLLVATKGVTASEEDGTAMGLAWAKAIKGKLMGLQKQGVNISKEQVKVFGKLKTDQARYNYLMKNFGNIYRGVNAEARKTDVGKIIAFRNTVKSLSNEIGDVLLPAQAAMADAWREFLTDPQIKGMLISSVKALAAGITAVADIVRDDLIPLLTVVGQSDAFKKLAETTGTVLSNIKSTLDLMGLIAKVGAPLDTTPELARKAFPKLPGPYLPDIPAAEKAVAPMREITGLDLFKPHVTAVKDFNMVTDKLPSSLLPSVAAMNDLKAAGRDVALAASEMSPRMMEIANTMTTQADNVAKAVGWWEALRRVMIDVLAIGPMSPLQSMAAYSKQVNTPPPAAPAPTPYQHGGIVTSPTLATLAERGPEAVVPLTGRGAGVMGGTSVSFAPNITINGSVSPAERGALDTNLRSLMRDFIAEFKRAQSQERRLSYEGGYS
jgi:hypothetical protein